MKIILGEPQPRSEAAPQLHLLDGMVISQIVCEKPNEDELNKYIYFLSLIIYADNGLGYGCLLKRKCLLKRN